MPSKLDFYAQMADHTAKQITGSFGEWTAFLETAGRLYKYPFHEQLMIFAQKPNATACADYDLWNKQMRRYVRRGTKGIALIDTSGDNPRLKYVFDVSDTGGRDNSRRPFLWEYRDEHQDAVTAALEQRYDISGKKGLADQLEQIASQLVNEYWNDNSRDILGILADSFLEEYDDYNVGVAFKNAAIVSTTYTLMSRCGLNPGDYLEHEDFLSVFDFNTRDTIAALGSVISNTSEQILRQIEITIKNYEREASLQQQAERTNDYAEQPELHAGRGLSDPEPDLERDRSEAPGQVRSDAEAVPAGAQTGAVEQHDPVGDPVSPSEGDRRDGEPEAGAADARTDEEERRDGGSKSQRPDEVGGLDEQSEGAGRGDDSDRADLQLNTSQQLTLFDLAMFPSEQEQMTFIDEAESVATTPFAFSFSQEDIDLVLCVGSNERDARMVVASEFEKQKSVAEIAATLREQYRGGAGFKTDHGEFSAWYGEDGIRLSKGRSSRYARNAQVISWESAAERIGQLLEQGQYATNVEVIEAESHERTHLADALLYHYGDMGEAAREQGFMPSLKDCRKGGFPDASERMSEQLKDPAFRQQLSDELTVFAAAYEQDRSLMRFRLYSPQRVLDELKDYSLPRREYASDMAEVEQPDMFITDDEIDDTIAHGHSVEGGKGRIYAYFNEAHNTKDKITFLKEEYGTGGRSHAVSRSGWEDHSAKGMKLQKRGCADVELPWKKVVPRIENMIRNDRYFTPEERVQYEEMQTREWQFTQNVNAYNDIKHDHPDDIVLFQVGDFFELYGEDAKTAARELDLTLTSRAVLGVGRVEMCGIPANRLDEFVEKLRQTHSVTISPLNTVVNEHLSYSMAKLEQPEAEAAEPVLSAETGANAPVSEENAEETKPTIQEQFERYKPVIKDAVSEDMPYRNACGHSDRENAVIEGSAAIRRAVLNSGDMELIRLYADMPEFRNRMHQEAIDETYPKLHELLRPLSQDDIDDALRAWNGDMDSKRAVVRYMNDHARDKGTAAWLSREYGGEESKSLFIVRAGSPEETELPWTKVQRRIAQLIKAEKFFTEAEYDNFEHIDPVVIRERLAERGIVNGEVVDEEKHNNSPFIQQVMADVEHVYAEENLIPGETTFTHNGQTYMVDKVNFDTGTVLYQNIGFTLPEGEEVFQSAPISTVRMYMEMEEAKAAQPQEQKPLEEVAELPYKVGDTVYLDDTAFVIRNIDKFDVQLQDPTLAYPIFRAESKERFMNLLRQDERNQSILDREEPQTQFTTETVVVYGAEENHLPYDVVIQTIRASEPEIDPPTPTGNPVSIPIDGEWTEFPDSQTAEQAAYEEYKTNIRRNAQNFQITDDHLGEGGAKTKYQANIAAIRLLKELEESGSQALPEQQQILSKYVGWGGLADAFDPEKENWSKEYAELKELLTPEEYAAARSSTLNAHYTSPTVIKAIYDAVGNMGFETGNILEPAMGVGNFFGCLPESMQNSKLYGVELDSITGRIAQQLYPKADITVAGFETTDRRDFYDLAIGNVPFGQYQVNDRAYNKLGFSIHDYFFAKALDQVRPGGVVAFVTSRYTMDKQTPDVRKYIAQRAELLGAIRLPNDAFKANAGTEVVSDIIFLQKRDHPIEIEPDWVHLGKNEHGFSINSYFIEHPDMILGNEASESTQYGKQDFTVEPYDGVELSALLNYAIQNINGSYQETELPDLGEGESIDASIPADPNVKNYSYTVVDGEVYYRENSRMVKPDLNATARERVKGMVELRDCVQKLINQQMDGYVPDAAIRQTQHELNDLYDKFTAKHGLINSRGNALAFADDSSYYLLCSLEVLDEDNNLKRKADMFTKRTIKPHEVVTSVDTASEALALSISEKACVDMEYMSQLTGKTEQELADDLRGVIYMDFNRRPDGSYTWRTADDFLSGNVREKLAYYTKTLDYTQGTDKYEYMLANVEALRSAQPKDLDASEIEVRLGATWIDKDYIQQFMQETFDPPYYLRRSIQVNYSPFSAEWNITGKSQPSYSDVNAYMTYGTDRANAYKILEDTLNLRDVRIYDTVTDPDGKERRVLNSKETTLAQQKQQAIKDAFQDWIWRDPDRRQELVAKYNELFNSNRPREYDGSHITFSGMNPEIQLREHQLNAVAHILYGGNTLLAHEVGAGKTFEMVAAAMESKRLGLCQKPLFVVPNHLTEQWASEFLRLYPSANILAATKKDFEPRNRKKFCGRIATGDYDAIIIGHSQFERIPVSQERQEMLLQEQIAEVEEGLEELKASRAERFTIKSLERTKKSLETRLKKLQDTTRKDDVITFEQLGVDRLYVDEAHAFKNLFLYTKMRNVAGLSTTDAQKSSDMLLKCRYIDEMTDSKGVVFATGTPVSNSMTELYTMMRYLQHDTIRNKGLAHFDCWASTFGETTTAIELAPEGTGYRARTRFAKFFNLPELMNLFKEAADIKTADQLNLPTPTPIYHNVVAQPTEIQQAMVQELSERAAKVHAGIVDASTDNMLKITSDGRKLGLDQRVINPNLPDEPTSKVNMCVDNIFRIWDEGQADKLTQLVFCDLSTPKTAPTKRAAKAAAGNLDSPEIHALEMLAEKDGGDDEKSFTVYDDIREKLVARGIPREQIAFIHEANTEARKKELFSKVRTGQVRVLMGSTFKMGAGMNVQDRLIALHDLDAPWRPGDLEQRSGRIIRQGNMNPEVHIYRYVTEATFDAYLWQTLENKQKFISQIMTSKSPVRACDDIDETALSYAEIKALCAGDERIKEKMDLDVDVARLKLMKANHQSQQYRLEDNLLKLFPEQIEQNKGFIAGFEADMKTLAEHPHPVDGFAGMTVRGDVLTDKENAGAALVDAFKEVKGLEPVQVGTYRGFQMSLTLEDFGRDYVLTLKGKMSHRVTLGKDPRGNLIRIDNVLNGMVDRLATVQSKLDSLYSQMETAKAELGKPFSQEEELRTKSARLAELNIELNIDDKTPMEAMAEDAPRAEIAKSAKPSVLQKLHSYGAPSRTEPKKSAQEVR